jgi:hypothetical protein
MVEILGSVEVEVVVAVKYAPTTCPATDNLAYGDDVPIPTFWLLPCIYKAAALFAPDWK